MKPQCSNETTEEKRSGLNREKENIPLVASAPPLSKRAVTPEIEQTIKDCAKKPPNSSENKYKCTITSEKVAQLRKIVETACKEHKVFTIKGGWAVIRRELLRRNWVEKFEANIGMKQKLSPVSFVEDVTSNLPVKQDWESTNAYVEKCEKTVMSRMLQTHDIDFFWNMRKDGSDMHHRSNPYKIINRFSRSLFASKEGLALLLQQAYWHTEPGVACVNFPRCYVLGFPDHYNLFVDDFRITACMGLLKWFLHKYETEDKFAIQSPEGQVPYSALEFAMDRCKEYVESQKHMDIDKDFCRVWDHEWEQFLTHYYIIVHQRGLFTDFKESLIIVHANVKSTLNDMIKVWPEYNIDGMRNIWILKPGNKCRGRGIQLIKNLSDVEKTMSLKLKYVVQKYIERPLIIYQTKFDIRQWFLVTSSQPLTIWMYRDSYLRFSSQIFSLENFHESLHLTNHAVQCKYANVKQRNKSLPDDNMWDCHTFQTYLRQLGCPEKWNEVIFPGMRESIVCAMLTSQDTMDRRPNTFELYGADFMLSEDFKPWLLEINCSPDLSFSTSVTSRLCPQCMEDLVKVIIDKRKDPKADTGLFDLVYKQSLPRSPPYLGMNLSVRGRKIFKNRTKFKIRENEKLQEKLLVRLKRHELLKTELIKDSVIMKSLPKMLSADLYKGPIIADLIEELQKSYVSADETGVDFVPALRLEPLKKKVDNVKGDRVHRKECSSNKSKTNENNSLFRKPNAKENNNKGGIKPRCKTSNVYFGFLKEWSSKNSYTNLPKNPNVSEKQTVSILEGKTLNPISINNSTPDINKNYVRNEYCNLFDLNQLLPQLNEEMEK